MAKQKGIIKLEGTIGDITFFKTADGYLAREYTPVSANQINNDPAFQRTRENMAEFGRAGKAAKLLRNLLRPVLINSKDGRMVSRLNAAFSTVIKADLVNPRGQRNVIDGEAELLQGFNFNNNAFLEATLFASFTPTIDRPSGQLSLTIPSFTPAVDIKAPTGATHFKCSVMAAAANFEAETGEAQLQETAFLPWNNSPSTPVNLVCNLSANSSHPLFLVLGIQFFQEVNSNFYPLKDGGFNCLQIVAVSGS